MNRFVRRYWLLWNCWFLSSSYATHIYTKDKMNIYLYHLILCWKFLSCQASFLIMSFIKSMQICFYCWLWMISKLSQHFIHFNLNLKSSVFSKSFVFCFCALMINVDNESQELIEYNHKVDANPWKYRKKSK